MKRPLIATIAVLIGVAGSVSGLLASRAGASSRSAAPPVVETAVPAAEPPPAPPEEPAASAPPPPSAVPLDGPPTLSAEPPLAEKTRAPKRADWKGAVPVKLTRSNHRECKARRIREWIRIDCEISGVDSVALLAGSRDGVDVWTSEASPTWTSAIVFPMRRGDRRVFQINESAGKYGVTPSAIVSEEWVEGEDAPAITIQRV